MANRLLVLIHGLGGDAVTTWAKFPSLLRDDQDIFNRYNKIESFQYETKKAGATQPLAKIALKLAEFIDKKSLELKIDEVAFITHSQGGLLARRYLCDIFLKNRDKGVLLPIFRLLTFATPHWGAYSELVKKWLPDSWTQHKELAFDSGSILALNNDWIQTDAEDRLQVLRVIADDDAVVPRFSALGANFQYSYKTVPGYGHIEIVKVQDLNHPSFGIAKTFLLEPTSYQPALVNPDKTPPVLTNHWHGSDDIQGTSRFVYTSRYVPLVERETEKKQLTAFLHTPTPANVAWMWIKSEGGVGKSRLALEFCLAWQSDWHTGFLNQDADAPDWARWQPQLPTLLVIDYATGDTHKLGRLLRGLCSRDPQYRLRRPVRVLLLDRHQQEDRLLEAIGHGSRAIGINTCRQPDLDLVTVDNPWAIIEHFLRRANRPLPDKAQVLKSLARIDPARRPLFAMLLADALMQKIPLGTLTRKSLLENVLDRERNFFWRPTAKETGIVLEKAERLLTFSTIVNGLSLSNVQEPIDQWDPDTFSPVFRVMAGYDSQTDEIAPLAPDLLGECFALQQLDSFAIRKRHDVLNLAWNKWPWKTFEFFSRVAQDFPDDPIFAALLDVNPENQDGWFAWSGWIVNLVGRTAAQYPERAVYAFETLTKLVTTYPLELKIRLHQIQAAVNLLCDLAPSHPQIAKTVFRKLGAFAVSAHEWEIRMEHAKAAGNLINGLAMHEPESAKMVFKELCALASAHPDEPELRLQLAITSANFMDDLATYEPETAKEVFANLCALASAYPGEPAIRLEQAKAASSLISCLAKTELSTATELFKNLCTFAAEHSGVPEIRLHQAKAAANLAYDLGTRKPESAKEVFANLCVLVTEHPNEPGIALYQAQASVNLIHDLAVPEPETAKSVFTGLCALAAAYPSEPAIRLECSKGAVNLITHLAGPEPSVAREYFKNLGIFAAEHQSEAQLRHCQAMAAINLIRYLVTPQPETAKAIFKDLCILAAAHPEDLEIKKLHAHGTMLVLEFFSESDKVFVSKVKGDYGVELEEFMKSQTGNQP
jgi:hypothetical protein